MLTLDTPVQYTLSEKKNEFQNKIQLIFKSFLLIYFSHQFVRWNAKNGQDLKYLSKINLMELKNDDLQNSRLAKCKVGKFSGKHISSIWTSSGSELLLSINHAKNELENFPARCWKMWGKEIKSFCKKSSRK